jgi:hypothetical protein
MPERQDGQWPDQAPTMGIRNSRRRDGAHAAVLQEIVDTFYKLHDEIKTNKDREHKGQYFRESAKNIYG